MAFSLNGLPVIHLSSPKMLITPVFIACISQPFRLAIMLIIAMPYIFKASKFISFIRYH